jgi:phenylpropionate dioxygenase-like ring-hydroxylating dioxygenase large terminal subunit
MLLRNAWYIAAWADEIGNEQPLARRICNEPIILFRDRAGRLGALADRCCHRAAPLSMGTVVEEGIQCGYHGLVIDTSGRCVRIPGQVQIPADARVRNYPVVEKH